MAIDMWSENLPLITSPRISFSHDLGRMDDVETMEDKACRADSSLILDSNSDQFDFSFSAYMENEPSSAEELFSDGLIRPLGNPKHPPLPNPPHQKRVLLNPSKSNNQSPFGESRGVAVFIVITLTKEHVLVIATLVKEQLNWISAEFKTNVEAKFSKANKNSSSSSSYVYQLSQKPPLKKNYGGAYGNGVWISPVLNMPPPYIAKGTANLFGLNSMFRDKKDKKNKK